MRLAAVLLLLGAGVAPRDEVSLRPARWRSTRQVLQKAAGQAEFRWAMPDGISRRAFVGEKPLALDALLDELCKQTGLTRETIDGVVVLHLPGARATHQDAREWPELAKAVVGGDLAAAQGLRRLEGEKALDWRLHGVSDTDPELDDPAPWQAPLGLAFAGSVPIESVEQLSGSLFIPLREAAARLTAACGEKGKALADRLAADPSPIVRAAATRTLQAWATPAKSTPKPHEKGAWHLAPAPDLKAAAEVLAQAKDHDTIWRLQGRRVGYLGTPEAIATLLEYGRSNAKWSSMVAIPLAEWGGGPEVIAWLKEAAGDKEYYTSKQGWGLWGLSAIQDGEALAGSLKELLEAGRHHWPSPPEYTAARAGLPAVKPLLTRMATRGHWVCRALGYIGGPEAVEVLVANLDHKDPGVAVAAAKGLGDTASPAAVAPLIKQLKHEDRLRRHWAVLGLGRIGGPEAARAFEDLLAVEQDRLVRKAAAELLKEIGPLTPKSRDLIARFEDEDRKLVPEYRPRNKRFDESFPVNTEVSIREHEPKTYSSIGETRVVMDWANRLMIRYGGCTGCYSNECFAFDVGTATWFPIRAADHFCALFNETRPNPGCSRAMAFDGLNKLIWIGQGIGGVHGPPLATHNSSAGYRLSAYDAALDRFVPAKSGMPNPYGGEPAKFFAFDSAAGRIVSSKGGEKGLPVLDVRTFETSIRKAPEKLPEFDHYPPPAFAYDPVGRKLLCTHPKLGWKLALFDSAADTWRWSEAVIPGKPDIKACGGLVYDSLNGAMILVGGKTMPTCLFDREGDRWVDLEVNDSGKLRGSDGLSVFDPEHNVILGLHGGAWRYKPVPVGTRARLE
jgi:hypothetical protein